MLSGTQYRINDGKGGQERKKIRSSWMILTFKNRASYEYI
jgi:hypothetical protein